MTDLKFCWNIKSVFIGKQPSPFPTQISSSFVELTLVSGLAPLSKTRYIYRIRAIYKTLFVIEEKNLIQKRYVMELDLSKFWFQRLHLFAKVSSVWLTEMKRRQEYWSAKLQGDCTEYLFCFSLPTNIHLCHKYKYYFKYKGKYPDLFNFSVSNIMSVFIFVCYVNFIFAYFHFHICVLLWN